MFITDGFVSTSLGDKVEHIEHFVGLLIGQLFLVVANGHIPDKLADRSDQGGDHLLKERIEQEGLVLVLDDLYFLPPNAAAERNGKLGKVNRFDRFTETLTQTCFRLYVHWRSA